MIDVIVLEDWLAYNQRILKTGDMTHLARRLAEKLNSVYHYSKTISDLENQINVMEEEHAKKMASFRDRLTRLRADCKHWRTEKRHSIEQGDPPFYECFICGQSITVENYMSCRGNNG